MVGRDCASDLQEACRDVSVPAVEHLQQRGIVATLPCMVVVGAHDNPIGLAAQSLNRSSGLLNSLTLERKGRDCRTAREMGDREAWNRWISLDLLI